MEIRRKLLGTSSITPIPGYSPIRCARTAMSDRWRPSAPTVVFAVRMAADVPSPKRLRPTCSNACSRAAGRSIKTFLIPRRATERPARPSRISHVPAHPTHPRVRDQEHIGAANHGRRAAAALRQYLPPVGEIIAAPRSRHRPRTYRARIFGSFRANAGASNTDEFGDSSADFLLNPGPLRSSYEAKSRNLRSAKLLPISFTLQA